MLYRACEHIVSRRLDIEVDALRASVRCSDRVAAGRHLVMYLAAVVLEMSQDSIGALSRRHRSTVSHALQRTEDRREGERFDALVTDLETCIADIAAPLIGDDA